MSSCLNQDLQDETMSRIYKQEKLNINLDELTYKINGCAMKVHNTLGNGFQEIIYQRCLAIELDKSGISFVREQEHTIYYEGIEVGTRRADFIIEDTVVVELKALINLEDVHLAQAKNYVVAYNKSIGLLINFGSTSLQFKKVYNPKYNDHQIKKSSNFSIRKSENPNKMSESGLNELMDDRITSGTEILQSSNPVNPDSDK
jgi:GxxExxY protein